MSKSSPVLLSWWSPLWASLLWALLAVACVDAESGADAGVPVVVGDAGCVDGACPACIDGAVGCACTSTGGCDNGLVCVDDVCAADVGCVGAAGCVCGSDGACDAGLSCDDDNRCTACEVGDVGCACRANLTCNDDDSADGLLVCNRDTQLCEAVVDDSEEPGVLSRACFTPCGESLTMTDGTFRFCDADGLMAGCIGALQCVDGSCVAEGEAANTCVVAGDCPQFQACVSGRCLSNCSFDADCGVGATCASHVCRTRCTTSSTSTCADGFTCKTSDTVDGVCMPQVQVVPTSPQEVPSPRLTVTPATLSFSNNRTSDSVRVTNTADHPVTFVVSRTEHFEFTPEGRIVVEEAPLFWPKLAVRDVDGAVLVAATRAETVSFDLVAGASADVVISDVDNDALSSWEGRLTITGRGIGSQPVWLDYATQPDGQWTGTLHSFIHFDDRNIDTWAAAMRGTNQQAKRAAALVTENALLVQWTQFRTNPLFVLAEWEALLQSVTTGSYAFSNVNNACRAQFSGATQARCYLYATGSSTDPGLRLFTDTDALRIPSGMIDMPVTLRLTRDIGESHRFTGRIETSASLQYGGRPAISVQFAGDPGACEASGTACLATISDLHAEILVGGRSLVDDDDCVVRGAVPVETPWLLKDFVDGTVARDTGRVRRECRESRFPFPVGDAANLKKNASLAAANPIPDGRVRRRQLELLDGVLVNQDTMHVLVRERFDANLVSPSGASSDTADFTTYGVLVLRRSAADLAQEVAPYEPGIGADDVTLAEPVRAIDNQCSAALLAEVGANTNDELARRLLFGFDTSTPPAPIAPGRVHVLCHATGNIDGGRTSQAGGGEACPVGSGVTFFLADGLAANAFANNTCQSDSRCSCVAGEDDDCVDVVCATTGTCADELRALSSNPANRITLDVPFQCNTPGVAAGTYTNVPDRNRVQCNDNRFDLRTGKLFYDPVDTAVVTPSLRNLIDAAFRYKSRFESRSDTGAVGFVPAVCALNSDALPYCYDPAAIEAARERVGCLMALFSSGQLDSNGALAAAAQEFLEGAFSLHVDDDRNRDGFERLYAELLIMLGDASLTDAVGSRFDLSGAAVAAFEGDLLEPGGLRLAGGAGHEMQLLYTAHQYYQLVLDRFAQASPTLWQGLSDSEHNVLSLDSIATYFRRVIQASTKKAQAASEIARRYQSFDRSDLARHVVERAYTEAYLESATISQLMRRSIAVLDANEVDALQLELDNAQRQYRQALEQMREVYQGITDELTFFGIAPDFIPFPAPGRFSQPAPRIMFERAFESLNIAKERENRALEGNRAFDVDAAQFQAELARVRQQYESQLSELCGVFTADGVQYPAITKYAEASSVTAVLGDPCGLLGQGTVFEASSEIESLSLALRAEIADLRSLIARVDIENERVAAECASRVSIADLAFVAAGQRITLRDEVLRAQQRIGKWEKTLGVLDRSSGILQTTAAAFSSAAAAFGACGAGASFAACVGGVTAASAATTLNTSAAAVQSKALAQQIAANKDITDLESEIREDELAIEQLSSGTEKATQLAQCCLDPEYLANPALPVTTCTRPGPILINSQAQVDTLLLDLKRASIEAARAEVDMRRGVGRLAGARSQVTRLLAQQEETEDHLINIEAARNDPNIRIFANADVLNADVAFRRAVVDAFRATRMYEYYTATSYANKDALFLVRLAGRGENNLEDYVIDLQRDFNQFEQDFGVPQQRVLMLSMMDDILKIPKVDSDGVVLLESERKRLLTSRLADPELLDDNGVIRMPFSTTADQTSPITANHKLTVIEAEMVGGGGDRVSRVSLRAKGTAAIRDFSNRPIFHRISPDTAVVNMFMDGIRGFSDDYYQNDRLRDRPLLNSLWELGLDLRNESVNRDIEIATISEIRVFLFYEDFTRE